MRIKRPVARSAAVTLTLFGAMHAVDDLYQGAVPALLPFLAASRHYSYAGLTGITLAATFLSSAIQPAFGVLADSHGLASVAVFPALSLTLASRLREPRPGPATSAGRGDAAPALRSDPAS